MTYKRNSVGKIARGADEVCAGDGDLSADHPYLVVGHIGLDTLFDIVQTGLGSL